MDRSILFTLMLAAIFGSSVASAQQRDPTVPEDARDDQTMVPEDADDTPPIRQATAPTGQTSSPTPAPPATPPSPPPAVATPHRLLVIRDRLSR